MGGVRVFLLGGRRVGEHRAGFLVLTSRVVECTEDNNWWQLWGMTRVLKAIALPPR